MDSRGTPKTHPTNPLRFAKNVLVKGLSLFFLANLVFMIWQPLPLLGSLSGYNLLFPGRVRLPYGDNPQRAYNISLYDLDAMLASHEISAGPKPDDEFRVILIGDSATWGYLLPAEQILSSQMNDAGMIARDGRRVRVYNLGYPVMSLTKDLWILSHVMRYEPDLIIWLFTLESFPYDKQLFPPLLQNNADQVRGLIRAHSLNLDPHSPELIDRAWWQGTIVGERRSLADLLRLQLYGVLWGATGIDQEIPETYTPRQEDLSADESFHNLQPPHLEASDLALDILRAGVILADETPMLLVNEPMFISQGENSDIRYNFYYPRWAYDDYRRLLSDFSAAQGWQYLDLWDLAPASEFTNSAVHMTPAGTRMLALRLHQAIADIIIAP